MERARKVKFIIMITLMVAIAGMSLGFAAFSATLNVSSSASVTPNSEDFSVVFCTVEDSIERCSSDSWQENAAVETVYGASSVYGILQGTRGKFASSFSKTGQSVTYTFYVKNTGDYDAYLRGLIYEPLANGSFKHCSPATLDSTMASSELVNAACDGINISMKIGGVLYEFGRTDIGGHLLAKGEMDEIVFYVEYQRGSTWADGPFNVKIADFKLNYSTVDSDARIINFTIDGVSYQAKEGMNFQEWINSNYNIDGYFESGYVYSPSYRSVKYGDVDVTYLSIVQENANYTISTGKPVPIPH